MRENLINEMKKGLCRKQQPTQNQNWSFQQEDRAAHFNKNVVKAFYTAGNLYEVKYFWYKEWGVT